MKLPKPALLLIAALAGSPALAVNTLVVSGDEWQLSDSAYSLTNAGTTQLAKGIAGLFGGKNYMLVSDNGNVPLSSLGTLASDITALGKTISTSTTFGAATLVGQDAVFLFGGTLGSSPAEQLLLKNFINGGGNVYISLGTGYFGSASAEAAAWNPLLNQFGLSAGGTWFPVAGFTSVSTVASGGALDAAVVPNSITWGYGQDISELSPVNPQTSLLMADFGVGYGTLGAFGIYQPVPEPGTYALMLGGLALLGWRARARTAQD
jgi:hypothetical protein